jgi:hypothetical protein
MSDRDTGTVSWMWMDPPSRARSVDCCCLLPADFGGGEGSGEAQCGRKGWGPARGVVVVAMVVEVAAVDGRI